MYNYLIKIEYDGSGYVGWQYQKNGKSIQEKIEKALKKILKENIRIIGAGRTDKGVHASGQFANFKSIKKIDNCQEGYVLEFNDYELNYIDKLIELAKLHPKKIKLLPRSKMMYVTTIKKKIEKISELKKFLILLLDLRNEK